MKRMVNISDLESVAKEFIENIKNSDIACVVALYGDLGAGKTTFTQLVAKKLGVTEVVTSPTFVIEKIYKLNNPNFDRLIHIDAYRLESGRELISLDWKKIVNDSKNLVFIEWPERVAEVLPENIKKIHFTFVDETTREIVVE
jgi:tRNA threonylcarbamoyladenosine biosynthesis protein TsaE